MSMPWVTVFLDRPAESFGPAAAFWSQVTGYRPAPAADGEPVALLPPSGDSYLRLRRLAGGPGGCGLGLHVDTGAESLEAVAGRAARPAPGSAGRKPAASPRAAPAASRSA